MQTENMLDMRHITKRFGGVKALTDVSIEVRKGEVHALVGENGAGKSTLMKILSGAYQMDSGEIFLDGQKIRLQSPKDAKDLGITVIYQEFMLAPDLTVAENIYIDKMGSGKFLINWKELRRKTKEQLIRLGFDAIDPNALVGSLSVAYQQVVEICKCLARNMKILVLDEPTAVLTFSEIEKLFGIINKLKANGVSIIYISHRMDEIFQLSDRITVLKDGQCMGTVNTSEVSKEQLVSMMVGRELTQMYPVRKSRVGQEVLRVENLNAGNRVKNVSFTVHAGEVLGFSGLVGSGRTETMRVVFGVDKKDSGEIFYLGKAVDFRNPHEAVAAGFGMLPEDRKKEGLILEQSIRINTTLASGKKVTGPLGFIHHKKEKEYVTELLKEISAKYYSTEDNANSLSGGNQQKIVLARWISANCKCVVFDEPTRGVDVGAKTEIYKIINDLAEKGVAVIIISSEMQEIIGMCDRAIIMRQGEVTGELDKEELNENLLIKYAMGM